MSSAFSQTSGGWPRIEIGSYFRSVSSVGTESGCGIFVAMRRNLVSTRATSRGTMLNSLPINKGIWWLKRPRVETLENLVGAFRGARRIHDGDTVFPEPRGDGCTFAFVEVLEIQITNPRRRVDDRDGNARFLRRGINAGDRVARFAREFDAANRNEADRETVHAVTDIRARAIGPRDITREVIVRSAGSAALVPPTEAAVLLIAFDLPV